MSTPKVTVLMRSKNSDWVIESALNALFSQEFTNFKLLVVDSGSTDKTIEIINRFPCKLVEIEALDYYPGQVLNNAIKQVDSEIIVFLNSDSVMLSPKSLGNLLSSFDDEETVSAFGRQIPRPEAHTWVQRDYAISFPPEGSAPNWITLSLPLAALRKEIWLKHPFYTDAWASEDTEWGLWAQKAGYKVNYVPSAITMHSHNYTLKEIYGRRFVEGEADAFIYGRRISFIMMLFLFLKSCLIDAKLHMKRRDLYGLLAAPARRIYYQWAYFKGNKKGNQRKTEGNNDRSFAQRIVLSSTTK